MKIGFLGCGKMANKMAELIKDLPGCELYACAARDSLKSLSFKNTYGFIKSYGNYEELVNDKEVDLIYISTITRTHYEQMKLCLNNKKNVLCEKPFTVNSLESKEVIDLAHKNNVYLAEAIWTRYMPSRQFVKELISSGLIGKPYLYVASIGYAISDHERMQDTIGGGVLLDCGVYPLNFIMMNSNDSIVNIEANSILSLSKVDETDIIRLDMTNNVKGLIYCTMKSNIDCSGYIYGDKGYIKFDHVNHPSKIEVYNNERPPKVIKSHEFAPKCGGYEYEWLETIKLINEGKKESISMPLSETQKVMETLDKIRLKAGIKFSNEK